MRHAARHVCILSLSGARLPHSLLLCFLCAFSLSIPFFEGPPAYFLLASLGAVIVAVVRVGQFEAPPPVPIFLLSSLCGVEVAFSAGPPSLCPQPQRWPLGHLLAVVGGKVVYVKAPVYIFAHICLFLWVTLSLLSLVSSSVTLGGAVLHLWFARCAQPLNRT